MTSKSTIVLAFTFSCIFFFYLDVSANIPQVCLDAIGFKGNDNNAKINLYTKCLATGQLGAQGLAVAHYNRGKCYSDLGKHDRAIADYTKVIGLTPDDAAAYFSRANSYGDLGNYERAIADFSKAIELDPDYAPAYNNFAFLLITAKNKQYINGRKAVQLALKAVGLANNNPVYWDTLAAAYAELGLFSKAIEAQLKAMLFIQAQGNIEQVKKYRKVLVDYEHRKKHY